jgi:uncharacterized protein (UPF0332 family)
MKPDLEKMLDKAEESLKAAEMLLEQGYAGIAASRAYYAMFYATESLLASIGQRCKSHHGVHSAFGKEFAKTGLLDPKFHRWLIDAQETRETGDYDFYEDVTPAEAKQLCAEAREFIRAAKDYLNKTP